MLLKRQMRALCEKCLTGYSSVYIRTLFLTRTSRRNNTLEIVLSFQFPVPGLNSKLETENWKLWYFYKE